MISHAVCLAVCKKTRNVSMAHYYAPSSPPSLALLFATMKIHMKKGRLGEHRSQILAQALAFLIRWKLKKKPDKQNFTKSILL